MLNFKYISSRGNEYDLLTTESMITECNAFDYEFSPVTFGKRYGSKIYGFEMEQKVIEMTLYFFGENRKTQINELIADFDYDVMNEVPGTLICNGYSISCYSVSGKDGTVNTNSLLWDSLKRTFVCPYPFWSKETLFELFQDSSTSIDWEDIKDYLPVSADGKADYEFDYMTHIGKNGQFTNTDLIGSEYKIVINGSAVNPQIRIGDLIIQMNITIAEGEFLIIDSRTKTITLDKNGTTENAFGYRDVSVDIFKKIPRGTIAVYWDDDTTGDYSWTLTLYDERTAPLWT